MGKSVDKYFLFVSIFNSSILKKKRFSCFQDCDINSSQGVLLLQPQHLRLRRLDQGGQLQKGDERILVKY